VSGETVYKKKRLLIERDTLLERIGQTIFSRGDMPERFTALPSELNTINILFTQLEERQRALREERDRIFWDMRGFQEKMTQGDKKIEEQERPLCQSRDELRLRLQGNRTGIKRTASPAEVADLEAQLDEIETDLARLAEKKRSDRAGLNEQIRPLEDRIYKLDRTLESINAEEENLTSTRKRRLRELGSWFYERGNDDAELNDAYHELDRLREQLAATIHQTEMNRVSPDPPVVKEQRNWLWLIAVFVVVAILGYINRTQYVDADLRLSDIAGRLDKTARDSRFYVDLARLPTAAPHPAPPVLADLPGGSVFRDLGEREVQAFTVSRDVWGDLRFCGIRFRRAPTRFSTRLSQLGWQFGTSRREWQVMIKDRWAWVVLNARTYFLLEADRRGELEALQPLDEAVVLMIQTAIEPFDANAPLLFGYDLLRYERTGTHVALTLRSSESITDLSLRHAYARHLGLERPGNALTARFSEAGLSLRTDTTVYTPASLSPTDLREALGQALTATLRRSRAELGTAIPEPEVPAEPVTVDHQSEIRLFRDTAQGLAAVGRVPLPFRAREMAMLDGVLLFLDPDRAALHRYRIAGNTLVPSGRLQLDEPPAGFDFDLSETRPSRLVLSPDKRLGVVLESGQRSLSPLMLLIGTAELSLLAVEELPAGFRRTGAAVWDSTGTKLYVTCTFRRRTGLNAGLLILEVEDGRLITDEYVNLDVVGDDAFFADLELASDHHTLYGHQLPRGRLLRFDLETLTAFWLEPDRLGRLATQTGSGSGEMLTSRDGSHMILLDPAGEAVTDRAVRLIEMGTAPSLLATFPFTSAPTSARRVPLSDRIWVCRAEAGRLEELIIQNDRLLRLREHSMAGFKPRAVVTDTWGHLLIVLGDP